MDLSFALKVAGWDLSSAKEETKETAQDEALDQVGTVMPLIIEALATSPLSEDPIHLSKLDNTDEFCIMVCAFG